MSKCSGTGPSRFHVLGNHTSRISRKGNVTPSPSRKAGIRRYCSTTQPHSFTKVCVNAIEAMRKHSVPITNGTLRNTRKSNVIPDNTPSRKKANARRKRRFETPFCRERGSKLFKVNLWVETVLVLLCLLLGRPSFQSLLVDYRSDTFPVCVRTIVS